MDKNTYHYEVYCRKCNRTYEFTGHSLLPESMICQCGERVVIPMFVGGYKNMGIINGSINYVFTAIKYNLRKFLESIFDKKQIQGKK